MKKPFTILGILNLTPDSFSDGGKFIHPTKALKQAEKMKEEGADLIDVGGESTRPGGKPVSVKEELKRVLPIVKKLKEKKFKISLDSRKPEVVEACLPYIDWINDVSGLSDPKMRELAAKSKKKVILMHSRELPVDPKKIWRTKDVVADLKKFFQERVKLCEKSGIKKSNIILDPGIGFGKNLNQNLQILGRLKELEKISPVCLGASRKSFIGKLDPPSPRLRRAGPSSANLRVDSFSIAHERLGGSLAAVLSGFEQGVSIFRVHDVRETVQALKTMYAISEQGRNSKHQNPNPK